MNRISFLLFSSSLALLTACGGGGGSSANNINSNSQPNDSLWTAGQFAQSTNYQDFCETPRTDTTFSDQTGTIMHEKMWLRSWSDETYLWYNEISDINPAPFSVLDYFEQLKTDETTSSGKGKDQFHFTYDTEEWQQRIQSGITLGYGLEWAYGALAPPRDIRVSFTEHNSPAALANIERGAELLEIDGIDFIHASSQQNIDIINAALFPENENEEHTFTFRSIGDDEIYSVNLTAQAIETSPVYNTKVINTDTGNVAYMQFNSFISPAEKPLIEAFEMFEIQNVTDLVLDLRYNGGGLLFMASQLAYMIGGNDNTINNYFYRFQYNDKTPGENIPFWPKTINWAEDIVADIPLPSLNLNRVYVLTSDGTCSASEAVMNGLRGSNVEVIQIGGTTCGKPYGFSGQDNCGTTYFTIQFQGLNHKRFGDYADGFSPINIQSSVDTNTVLIPGCAVNDDFSNGLGSTSEKLLATALSYRDSSICPDAATSFYKTNIQSFNPTEMIKDNRKETLLLNNALMMR